ncbi:hypothetical protein N2152v2_000860 [Parachlorella kessleri]
MEAVASLARRGSSTSYGDESSNAFAERAAWQQRDAVATTALEERAQLHAAVTAAHQLLGDTLANAAARVSERRAQLGHLRLQSDRSAVQSAAFGAPRDAASRQCTADLQGGGGVLVRANNPLYNSSRTSSSFSSTSGTMESQRDAGGLMPPKELLNVAPETSILAAEVAVQPVVQPSEGASADGFSGARAQPHDQEHVERLQQENEQARLVASRLQGPVPDLCVAAGDAATVVALAEEQMQRAHQAQQQEAQAQQELAAARQQIQLMAAQVATLEESLFESRRLVALPLNCS